MRLFDKPFSFFLGLLRRTDAVRPWKGCLLRGWKNKKRNQVPFIISNNSLRLQNKQTHKSGGKSYNLLHQTHGLFVSNSVMELTHPVVYKKCRPFKMCLYFRWYIFYLIQVSLRWFVSFLIFLHKSWWNIIFQFIYFAINYPRILCQTINQIIFIPYSPFRV